MFRVDSAVGLRNCIAGNSWLWGVWGCCIVPLAKHSTFASNSSSVASDHWADDCQTQGLEQGRVYGQRMHGLGLEGSKAAPLEVGQSVQGSPPDMRSALVTPLWPHALMQEQRPESKVLLEQSHGTSGWLIRDKPCLMLQRRQRWPHSSATLTCNLWTYWKLNLKIQHSFLWHCLTPLISELQGWTPELVKDNRHHPLALTAPKPCAWRWLSLIAELCHQVCHHVPRSCGARRGLTPSSQWVGANGRDGGEIIKVPGLCSTQQTAPSRVSCLWWIVSGFICKTGLKAKTKERKFLKAPKNKQTNKQTVKPSQFSWMKKYSVFKSFLSLLGSSTSLK